jgi:hypothetical protein
MLQFQVKSGTAFGDTPSGALANLLQVNATISLTPSNSFSDHLAAQIKKNGGGNVDRYCRVFWFRNLHQRSPGQGL